MTGHPALLHDPTGYTRRVVARWDAATDSLWIEDGPTGRQVPADRLTLAAGGWRGDAIHLSWEEAGRRWAVTLEGPRSARAFLDALPARFAPEVARVRRQAVRSRRARRLGLAVLLLVCLLPVALLASAFLLRDRLLDAVVRRLPPSVDRQLGEAAARQLALSGQVLREGPAAEAVRILGARLVAAAGPQPFAFRFEVLRHPAVNAFAAPGGLVVVHTGLLAEAASPDELAGVLAHEVTHVLRRHSLRQLLFQVGLFTTLRLMVGVPDGVGDALAGVLADLSALRFSRDQEREADEGAVALLARARLPADGLVDFFERLARRGSQPPALLSTHPPSAERAASLRRLIAAYPPWPRDPPGLDWEAVRRQARQTP